MGIFDKLSGLTPGGLSEKERNFMLRQGIMGLGAQMLQAGAPSTDPRSGSMAYALGQGLQGFQQGQQGALPQIQATQKMAQTQAAAEARRKFGEKIAGMYGGPGVVQTSQMPPPGVPPTAVPLDTGVGVGIGAPGADAGIGTAGPPMPPMMGGPPPGGLGAPRGGLAEIVGSGIGAGMIEPGAGLGLLQPAPVKDPNLQRLALDAAGGDPVKAWELMQQYKKAGGVSVSVGAEQSEYQKARGRKWAETAAEYQTNAGTAQGRMYDLNRASQLLEGMPTGAFAEKGTKVSSWARSIGIDIDPNLGDKEAMIALSNKMALGQRKPGSGVMTDKDFEVYRSAVASMTNSPGANKRILEYEMKLAQRDIELAGLAAEYEQTQGRLDSGFNKVRKDFVDANPLFSAKKQPLIMR